MDLTEFLKPELLILVPVLNLLGTGIKKSNIADKWIPLILGGAGIFLAMLYMLTTEAFGFNALFAALTQGILAAGLSVYANQICKQLAGADSVQKTENADTDKSGGTDA